MECLKFHGVQIRGHFVSGGKLLEISKEKRDMS